VYGAEEEDRKLSDWKPLPFFALLGRLLLIRV
jgi:hypothetical protein